METEDFELTNVEDEHMLEEIRGETHKKKNLSLLNQKKVNSWELDELFAGEDYEEEF